MNNQEGNRKSKSNNYRKQTQLPSLQLKDQREKLEKLKEGFVGLILSCCLYLQALEGQRRNLCDGSEVSGKGVLFL